MVAIVAGGSVGWALFPRLVAEREIADEEVNRHPGWPFLALFVVFLVGLPIVSRVDPGGSLAVLDGFYRAGSLVFGGGHVVLPLLDAFVVGQGWADRDIFLAGYGAAQALPGPLFAFSGFLGSVISAGPGSVAGGLLSLTAIYLPSWLLVLGAIPYWDRLRRLKAAQAALMGANAAVVGLLLAAFYDPIWTVSVTSPGRLAYALVVFGLAALHLGPGLGPGSREALAGMVLF